MIRIPAFVPLLLLAACGGAGGQDWRAEEGMRGVEYVGRVPQDGGGLIVEGWRNDGGFYVSDDLHSVSVYSTPDRIGVSAEALRHREPDGVPAWRIADFWSHPGGRETAGVNQFCGMGADWTAWSAGPEDRIVGLVEWDAAPLDQETYHDAIAAAARINLVTGEVAPIATDGVYCQQSAP